MFVEYGTTVPLGLGAVERVLEGLSSEMGELADLAYREGEELRSRVGPVDRLAKSVALEVGTPQLQRRGLVYPVRWSAVGGEALFPEMIADLVLTQAGSGETNITLRGTYDPPLGMVGRVLDRALLGKVAEATVRQWVDRLADAITTTSSADRGAPASQPGSSPR